MNKPWKKMAMRWGWAGWLGLLALLVVMPASDAAERVALVIGNGAYADRPLRNPVNDAADLAAALETLGFQVLRYSDLDRKGLHRALQAFREALRGQPLGLFYYAGHGAQYNGRNYLIPVNAEIQDAADLPIEALAADSVLAQMQSAGNQVSVVILDACRNLPYPGANRSSDRGLARLDAIRGSLVAYATSPGSVAQDGAGRNSPYATALLAEISKPGVPLTELFNNVGWAVARATNNAQEPWYSSSPLPKIYLAQASVPSPFRPVIPDEAPAEGSRPAAGQVFQDTLSDGTRGPAMVIIPAGEFWMGSPDNETGRDDDERRHRVKIGPAFALGQFEVTVGEFKRFVEAMSYRTDAERDAKNGCRAWSAKDSNWDWRAGLSWRDAGYPQKEDHPVVCVSWNDAQRYVTWLSERTGQVYRLPSEAEWEYAARAGTTSARYWGDDPEQACQYANGADQTEGPDGLTWNEKHECKDGYWFSAPVGSFRPNDWKLYDVLGNVWEWTCSAYAKDYDGSEAKCANKDTTDPLALRGGSWNSEPTRVRSADRDGSVPTGRFYDVGFRLARSL
ncbi:MAG: SUMF1/EgtB/PvdO family nonheme iron enzyme [Gammaproteobacteria bacterium]|nr:SUMF1/EgtB/PvdO family nonheme iron enzyme [Gammaproteobacteria bacterium]